jgi:hypothetical protein
MESTWQSSVPALIFNFDEVGGSEWEDGKEKKAVVPGSRGVSQFAIGPTGI